MRMPSQKRTKEKFVSTMSDEKRREIGEKAIAAMDAGNRDLAYEIVMQIPLSLPMARVLKEDWGLERLKRAGFNLDDAVAAYGKEWLEE